MLQVFKKLGLNPYDLNVDQLDMHAVSAHDWHVGGWVGVAYSLVHCLVTFFIVTVTSLLHHCYRIVTCSIGSISSIPSTTPLVSTTNPIGKPASGELHLCRIPC